MSATATARPLPADASMTDLFNAYGDAWASHDADAIAAFHSEDGIFHLHADGEPVRGREAIRETFAAFLTQWPDLDFAEEHREIGDWGWVVRWRMSGTLAASGEVAEGIEAEAGTQFNVDAVDVIEVRDGLLAAKHTYLDSIAMERQLGSST